MRGPIDIGVVALPLVELMRDVVIDQRLLEDQLPGSETILQAKVEPDFQGAGNLGVGRDELRRVA